MDNGATSPASPSRGAYSSRSNALSNKLTSVMSRSFADPEIKDSLSILEHQGFVNSANGRSRLGFDAQKQVIECNGAIVKDFGQVAEQLKRIGTMITKLDETCSDVRKHIEKAQKETGPMLAEASSLTAQKRDIETKQQVVCAFNKHFMIPVDDVSLANTSSAPTDDRFFEVIHRLKQTRKDCEALLGSENQTLGVELMQKTSRNLNAAFENLYHWVQREFKNLDLEDPGMSSSIRRALRVLAERPTLFQNCLEVFAEAREQILSNAFHAALTDASGGDSSKASSANPIELQTHDLLRYLGDMLAWVHSATVSEKEALGALFITDGDAIAKEIEQGRANERWSRLQHEGGDFGDEVQAFDGAKTLKDLVNLNLEGVGRALKQRIEIAVQSNEEPLLVHRALNLLGFYRGIFGKLVGDPSNLRNIIVELEAWTLSHFERLIREQTSAIGNETTPEDLSSPPFLANALNHFKSIMTASPDLSLPEISRLLSTALVPFLDHCSEMACTMILDEVSQIMFHLNCLFAVNLALIPILPPNHGFLPALRAKIKKLREELTTAQHTYLLHQSGVDQLRDAICGTSDENTNTKIKSNDSKSLDDLPSPKPLPTSTSPSTFQPGSLSSLATQLDNFLPSAQMDMLDNMDAVADKAFVKEVAREAAERFCLDFQIVEQAVLRMDDATRGSLEAEEGEEEEEDDSDDDGNETEEQGKREKEKETSGGGADKILLRDLYPRTMAEIRVLLT